MTCAGASPPSARGGELREQRRRLLAVARRCALEQVQRGGRRGEVPLAQARAEGRAVGAHAELFAPEPVAARLEPSAPAPTSARISRMMRVMSKSLGV